MDLSHVILGPVVTEKSERLKAAGPRHTHTMLVHQDANKIDVKKAVQRYYDVDVESVRMVKTKAKSRKLGDGRVMEKRHAAKKALVTLAPKSKSLDLSTFGSAA
ncbi:MAG: 50S ribosomal protein L23 [Patescibacteria group bacterium]